MEEFIYLIITEENGKKTYTRHCFFENQPVGPYDIWNGNIINKNKLYDMGAGQEERKVVFQRLENGTKKDIDITHMRSEEINNFVVNFFTNWVREKKLEKI